jgi:hypothetical protein
MAGEAPGPRVKLKASMIPTGYNAPGPLTAEVKKGQSQPIQVPGTPYATLPRLGTIAEPDEG